MNSLISAVLGAVTLAVIYGAYLVVRKTWDLLDGVIKASKQIPELVSSIRALLRVAQQVAIAIEALQTALMGGQGQQPGEQPPDATQPPRRPMPAFPGAPPVFAPDAKEEDTEIIDTTDKELAELEQVDEIRGRGYSVEQDESIAVNPPGVTKDASV